MSTYRPLPHDVTVQSSDIEGLGLFAKANIEPSRRLLEHH
jgi:hypothetical protein